MWSKAKEIYFGRIISQVDQRLVAKHIIKYVAGDQAEEIEKELNIDEEK